jgi:hypothetical protein
MNTDSSSHPTEKAGHNSEIIVAIGEFIRSKTMRRKRLTTSHFSNLEAGIRCCPQHMRADQEANPSSGTDIWRRKVQSLISTQLCTLTKYKSPRRKNEQKTYNSGYSLVVTHLTTNPPVRCLNRAERTGSLVFNVLWSYVKRTSNSTV